MEHKMHAGTGRPVLDPTHLTLLEAKYSTATPEFQHAADALYKAQDTQTLLDENTHRALLIDAQAHIQAHRAYDDALTPAWITAVGRAIWNPTIGRSGTDVNRGGLGYLNDWLVRAIELGYNLTDVNVRDAFAHFCLANQTAGYVGKDTNTTTTGERGLLTK